MTKTLDTLRQEIDSIDDEIIALLAKRMERVTEVGQYKSIHNIAPLDEKRWQQVLQTISAKAKKQNLSEELVKEIYELIHQEALVIEKKV